MPAEFVDLFTRHFDFWPQLSAAEKELLLEGTHVVHYPKGTHVHQGALDCIGVHLLKKGQLRVYTMSEDGREVTLYRLFADDVGILSAPCVLESLTFEVYVDAEEDTEALLIKSPTFRKLSDMNIHVRAYGYQVATRRLSDMLWKMQQVLFLSADRRFAIFLLEESEQNGSAEIHLTHEQIARYMGTAREVVSRMVKYFNQEGWIKNSRGCIRILNREALEKLKG
ncbi:MAG: Crp/Fnr family transcriptional regulator [Selenomonas sp.]|uniref:Crp/Fnr family transcriptional regulator n=1 Tax=Selenomonas sp. TaxID=2053611 RepID=UPI0025E17BF6|nr:Crp/Fnr family transcriptional regulator [Selenomonas sp.]MCR5757616.1 Crp/Fnr family transcriptional regulator [Selenomonas sp.]